MSGERSTLRTRPAIALLTAEGISSLGSQMTFLALPWFVLVTTGSAAKMSIVLAVEIPPVALLWDTERSAHHGASGGPDRTGHRRAAACVVGAATRAPVRCLGQFLATLLFAFYALRRGRQEAPVTLEAA